MINHGIDHILEIHPTPHGLHLGGWSSTSKNVATGETVSPSRGADGCGIHQLMDGKHFIPGHRLLILINILEINQYFSFSKNIDFCIDFAIDFGIDSETAKFDQIWSNLIKFDQIWSNFAWFWSNLIKFRLILIKFDQIWSSLIKLHFLSFAPCLLIFHTFPCWFSIEKARLETNKNYWFLFENID